MSLRRGFNLIEAAIVLGVVGLVIGGIWVAAAAVIEKQKVNQMSDGILQMSREICAKIPRSENLGGSGSANIDPALIAMNIPPSDWIKDNQIQDPWGNHFTVRFSTTGEFYYFNLNNLPKGRCMALSSNISSRFRNRTTDYYMIWFRPNNIGSFNEVISPNDVTYCAAGNNQIDIAFRLCRNRP